MTQPIDEIIPRVIEPNVQQLLDKFALTLEEVVNFGSNVLFWDNVPKIDGDHNIPATMLLRHFLDLIDSISILTYKGSGDAMKLQARAVLEITLYAEYLFEKDTMDRSMAFLVEDTIRLIKSTKKLIPNTESGKMQHKKFKEEGVLENFREMADFSELESFIAAKERLLAMPQYNKAYEEYKRLIKLGEKNPNWYRYFNGPRNIEAVASYLKQGTIYDILYRKWSGSVHGTDIYLGKLSSNNDGKVYITQIRYMKDVQDVISWMLILSVKMFKAYIDVRVPERKGDFINWYREQSGIIEKLNKQQWIKIN